MSGFIRRFTQDPGQSTIQAIEGVVIIDREPPGSIQGAGTGVVTAIAELEDGPYNVPTAIFSPTDMEQTFGTFGFTYDGIGGNNPCARARKADAAVSFEYWNGNGFVSLAGKKFAGLILVRPDTSVGEVLFTRNASVTGAQAFTYTLATGQSVGLVIDEADGAYTLASILSGAGVYPVSISGKSMSVKVDGAAAVPISFSTETTRAQLIARINTVLGFEAAVADTLATKILLRSLTDGPTGSIEITAVTDGAFTTATGFAVTAVVNATSNIQTATFTGAVAALASAAGTYPTTFAGGESLNLTIDEGTPQQIGPVDVVFLAADQTQADVISRINAALGYTGAVSTSSTVITISGRIGGTAGNVTINSVSGGAVTTATGYAADDTASGTGNVADISQVTFNEIKTIVEAAAPDSLVEQDALGRLRISSTGTGEDAYILVETVTATALGFTVGQTDSVAAGAAGVIPAGTRVTDGTTIWVTAQSVDVLAGTPGPYTARVRPATDDGTASGANVSTVTQLVSPISFDTFAVTNNLPIAAALGEAAIDAAYAAAIDATLNSNAESRRTNLIVSSRQSNAIRTLLRQNAIQASSEGLSGRIAVVRPPLGTTTRAQARSTTAQPGVGAYRNQRVIYAYPGAAMYVPQVASRGLAGGDGFTVDGIVDVGFDFWVASCCSQLPPEENPGQATDYMTGIMSVERGNPDVQDMRIGDYEAFKAAGIAALRIDDGVPIMQSGVTSVDPAVYPNLKNIARRRMADYIQDSVAPRLKAYIKKTNTRERRAVIFSEVNGFMDGLLSRNNPASQRIDSYLLDAKSGNTVNSLAAGMFRLKLKAKTLSSLDNIIFDTEIGENVVTMQEAA